MKITTEIVNIIVNQYEASNSELFKALISVAELNNITHEYVINNVDLFMQEVCKSVYKVTRGIIDTAKSDIFVK